MEVLNNLQSKDAIPNSMLFHGINGTGKKDIALAFSMSCNCSQKNNEQFYCGSCKSCKKILSKNHPDILTIEPEGNFIKIAQIRELYEKILFKPFEALKRFILIIDADKMNKESANALLKILEEPPAETYFILTMEQVSKSLPTILSRCQKIRFNPIPHHKIEKNLIEKYEINSDDAFLLSKISRGSMSKALVLNEDKLKNRRKWIIDELLQIKNNSLNIVLAFAENISKEKKYLPEIFEIFLLYFRDLLIFQYNPEKIINIDYKDSINNETVLYSKDFLLDIINDIQKTIKAVNSNAAVRLSIENLLIKIAGI